MPGIPMAPLSLSMLQIGKLLVVPRGTGVESLRKVPSPFGRKPVIIKKAGSKNNPKIHHATERNRDAYLWYSGLREKKGYRTILIFT